MPFGLPAPAVSFQQKPLTAPNIFRIDFRFQGQNGRLLAQLADNDRVNNDIVAERVKVPQTSACFILSAGSAVRDGAFAQHPSFQLKSKSVTARVKVPRIHTQSLCMRSAGPSFATWHIFAGRQRGSKGSAGGIPGARTARRGAAGGGRDAGAGRRPADPAAGSAVIVIVVIKL